MEGLSEVRPGEVLAGKYRIERVLGQGGMGVVVSATHVQLEERVAIKFLLPAALENQEAVGRFAREARAAVKIKSEHVARVTDVGTLETGCPYMVMEYLHGSDLSALVHERGALPIEEAVEFVLQACEALAEAHTLGIIHRDLKPANLFHTRRADGSSCIKVLDFGISKVTGLSGSGRDLGLTRTTTVMGSPLYMSPEQMASSRDVDARTDIWALGVILYELLAGRVPFTADTMPQLCAMILQQPPPPLRNARPDAPESLQAALNRCLEKDPTRRYANIAEFANALLPFATRNGRSSIERVSRVLSVAGISSSQLEMPHSSQPTPGPVAATQAAWGQTAPPAKRRTPVIVALLVVVAAGAAGAGALVMQHRDAAQSTAAQGTSTPVEAVVTKPNPATTTSEPARPNVEPTAVPEPVVNAVPSTAPPVKEPTTNVGSKPIVAHAAHGGKKPAPEHPAPPEPSTVKRPVSDLYSDRK